MVKGGMCGEGVCMVGGWHAWQGGMHGERGVCMTEGMCGRGMCMTKGGVHGEGGMYGEGVMHGEGGHAWQRGGHAWYACTPFYEIRLVNAWAVRILLEFILVGCVVTHKRLQFLIIFFAIFFPLKSGIQ